MIRPGRYMLLGIKVSPVDYEYVTREVIKNAKHKKHFSVAPVASHPIVLSISDQSLRKILNSFQLIIPDSQYVKKALDFIYGVKLRERVYGPELFLNICRNAEKEKIKIFLMGNEIRFVKNTLNKLYPALIVDGYDLKGKIMSEIKINDLQLKSNDRISKIIFIGIGSPNQYFLMEKLNKVHYPIIGVGAAFDFVSGAKPQAPLWMQKKGLEWLFRLKTEPKRLWKRYLIYGPFFIILVIYQKIILSLK